MTDALLILTNALYVALMTSLPLLLVAFAVGAAASVAQSAMRLTEPSLNAILRLVSALLALSFAGPFMATEIAHFAAHLYQSLPDLVH